MHRIHRSTLLLTALLALAAPAALAVDGSTSSDGFGWHSWGVRVGVASDADQVVGGAHVNFGEVVNHLRFQPDLQLGSGDDVTTLYGTAPLYYRFAPFGSGMTPYAGGGLAVGWVDYDAPPGFEEDDSDVEVGGKATGGLEWERRGGQAMAVELSLGFGDVHDVQVVGCWSF